MAQPNSTCRQCMCQLSGAAAGSAACETGDQQEEQTCLVAAAPEADERRSWCRACQWMGGLERQGGTAGRQQWLNREQGCEGEEGHSHLDCPKPTLGTALLYEGASARPVTC